MTESESVSILARDVVPYRYGVWSSVAGEEPFANQIVHMRWSEDGEHLWFGLETHNTVKARPDEVLELVEMSPLGTLAKNKAAEWALPPRPKPNMKQNPYACGDGGCVLLVPGVPVGMHTNAGCRCIPLKMTPNERVRLRKGIRWLAERTRVEG